MTKQLMIYENVVPVNRNAHRDVSVRQTTSFDFARETNTVPIVDVEFIKVAVEMPILFAKTATGVAALALLGTQQDRNAFVAEDGNWTGRYVPAFFRRYPFVFALQEDGDRLTLCIDESYKGLNKDGKGERMFDSEGVETAYTKNVLRFVEEYQSTFNRSQAFCDRLLESGLLEEARIDYRLNDGTTGGVTGFMRVSVEKLRALPDEKVVEMFRNGDLDLIQLHLMSMQQVEPLVAKLVQPAAAVEEDKSAKKKGKSPSAEDATPSETMTN
ncbi:MAG: peptidase [Limimaricola sp.]|uniref:SapC family protein n=1 Tax=Limimaricola sp. TaxID=2211665 RepID=UPI001D4187CD|nr:SapC family protein [Limimaricola sp.]MBI1417657.1 peptidase [Limimaricola sp.]